MNSAWAEEQPAPPRSAPPWRLWREALSLMVLRRPVQPARPLGIAALLGCVAAFIAAGLVVDDLSVPFPRWGNAWAATDRSFPVLVAVLLGMSCAAAFGRTTIAIRAASAGLLAAAPALVLWPIAAPWLEELGIPSWIAPAYAALVAVQVVRWMGTGTTSARRWGAALAASAVVVISIQTLPYVPWWWSAEFDGEENWEQPAGSFSAESVWNRQPQLVDLALTKLAPQRPGVIDLYAIAMAGDGSETAFRNEVELIDRTLSQRFGAANRVLSLVNHPDTYETVPLASVSNLRRSLSGLSSIMDHDEDVLLLFVTSHGSADHEILLELEPLPLDQLVPSTLAAALDESGIRWRVLVLSACYSGGFVEALKQPDALVITAARADRKSFGCGVDSEITWFGRAFIEDAMSETTDFFEAFRLAKGAIQRREEEEGMRASLPQIARGNAIGAKLEAWRDSLTVPAEQP